METPLEFCYGGDRGAREGEPVLERERNMVGRGSVILCAGLLLAGPRLALAAEAALADPGAPVFHDVEQVPRGVLLARDVDMLIDRVVGLNEHHGWRWSEAGALIASLEEAFLDLDRDQLAQAARQLNEFSDRIAAYVNDGSLPKDAGVPLLDAAGAILGRIDALQRTERLAGPAEEVSPEWDRAAPGGADAAPPARTP
jgi:hypothetical protein